MRSGYSMKSLVILVFSMAATALLVGVFQTSEAEIKKTQANGSCIAVAQEIRTDSPNNGMDDRQSVTKEDKQVFSMKPIGFFHSPYTPERRPPRQGRLAPDVSATIEVYEEFMEGLEGIEDFDCIFVIFVFDRSQTWEEKVTPPGAQKARGVFATRSPNRPCPIGLTVVRLEKREGRFLFVKGIDAFDRTPILDIKPYIGSIDAFPDAGKSAEKNLGLKPEVQPKQ